MEIFELKYFLAVAREEHVHRASERLRVSAPALSKAISRLESELGKKLFSREGRHIRLTEEGRALERHAREIVELEENARLEFLGENTAIHAVIAGPEVLLSGMGMSLVTRIRKRFSRSSFEFRMMEESAALLALTHGEAHLALVTTEIAAGLRSRKLADVRFCTCVGPGHDLYQAAREKRVIPIAEVLKFPFASPDRPILGKTRSKQALDGWRDDIFPRRIEVIASSLKVLEAAITSGQALAYLPDYFAKTLEVAVLRISGCPYSCTQTVKLVAPGARTVSWVNQIF